MKKLMTKIRDELKANPIIEIILFVWGLILLSTLGIAIIIFIINYVLKHTDIFGEIVKRCYF